MNKNVKHNLCLVFFDLTLGLMGVAVYFFIFGLREKIISIAAISSIVFLVCIPILVIIIKIRPYKKTHRKNKGLKCKEQNSDGSASDDI